MQYQQKSCVCLKIQYSIQYQKINVIDIIEFKLLTYLTILYARAEPDIAGARK